MEVGRVEKTMARKPWGEWKSIFSTFDKILMEEEAKINEKRGFPKVAIRILGRDNRNADDDLFENLGGGI